MALQKEKKIDMLASPMLPQMLRFVLPLLATYLLDIAFTAADTMVAGQCAGSSALAAVSACSVAINLMVGVFNGLAVGATVVIARYIGEKNADAASGSAHTAAGLSGVLGLIVLLLGAVLSVPLLRAMNTPADIFDASALYFRIRIIGLALDVVYLFCAGMLRATGETKKPLVFSGIAGVLNVILNYALVAWAHMGVAGLAIATNVSSLTRLFCILYYLMHTNGVCRLELKKIKLRAKYVWQIIRIGLPSSMQSLSYHFSHAIIQGAINSLGTATVAGGAAAYTYLCIADSCAFAADHAATTWASQNFGARRLDRIWKIAGTAILISSFFLVPMALVFLLFGKELLMVFVQADDPNLAEILHAGTARLCILGCLEVLHAALNIGSGVLRGIQKPWLAMISAVTGAVVVRAAWIWFVFPLYPTIEVIYVCIPLAWVMTAAFIYAALPFELKKYKKSPYLPTT